MVVESHGKVAIQGTFEGKILTGYFNKHRICGYDRTAVTEKMWGWWESCVVMCEI